jgi:hypothetical protein
MAEEKKEGVAETAKEGVEKIEKVGKSVLAKAGFWTFLIGMIIALIAGLLIGYGTINTLDDNWGYIATVLAVLGFVVGLISAIGLGTITSHEVTRFLVAAVAVVVVGGAAQTLEPIPVVGPYLGGVTLAMLVFFAPAAIILALKALWDLGKEA